MTEKEVRGILAAIHTMFPRRFPLDPETLPATVGVWRSVMEMPLGEVKSGSALAATRRLLAVAKHPPTAAEVIEETLSVQLAGPSGADAWGEVCKAIGRWGRNRWSEARSSFSSPAIADSVDAIGGWVAICGSSNTVSDRARFIDDFEGKLAKARLLVLKGDAIDLAHALGPGEEKPSALPWEASEAVAQLSAALKNGDRE